MDAGSVLAIVKALQDQGARYLIVGGLAVVHHGYLRFTADVDIVLDMDQANIARAIRAFTSLGYRPRVPVPFAQYADPQARAMWAREKNLKVFPLWSPDHQAPSSTCSSSARSTSSEPMRQRVSASWSPACRRRSWDSKTCYA
jgi:hypothetical protein